MRHINGPIIVSHLIFLTKGLSFLVSVGRQERICIMVAHVEEAYALLDEFEVGEESNRINRGPPLCPSACGWPPLHWNKRSCNGRLRTNLMAIVLLTAFGVIITLYGTRTNLPVGEQIDHLGYLLHPQAHASRPPTTLVFNWTITSGLRSPDGVEKQVYLVNGKSLAKTEEI